MARFDIFSGSNRNPRAITVARLRGFCGRPDLGREPASISRPSTKLPWDFGQVVLAGIFKHTPLPSIMIPSDDDSSLLFFKSLVRLFRIMLPLRLA